MSERVDWMNSCKVLGLTMMFPYCLFTTLSSSSSFVTKVSAYSSRIVHNGPLLFRNSCYIMGGKRRHNFAGFHSSTALSLNRFLFDISEVDDNHNHNENSSDDNDSNDNKSGGINSDDLVVTLPKGDYRTVHAAKILGVLNGDTIRAGIVKDRNNTNDNKDNNSQYCGYVTDEATIEWIPEGKIKKAQPTKNGDPPGSLKITLASLTQQNASNKNNNNNNSDDDDATKLSVSLILALPRPLQLGRMLPIIAQMGVDHIVLTAAEKVPKDYFGSHLFRKPDQIRKLLIEGLCQQAGDTLLPKVTIVRNLPSFFSNTNHWSNNQQQKIDDDDDNDNDNKSAPSLLDELFPSDTYTRVIAHPQRMDDTSEPLRMRNVPLSSSDDVNQSPNIVIAIGPEGGWSEPNELEMFQNNGFHQITLGTRILRSDVAVVNLIGLAHDAIHHHTHQ